MKSYRLHHLAVFGWAIDVYRDGTLTSRHTGYLTRVEAARALVYLIRHERG